MKYELRDAKTWARTSLRGYVAVSFTPYDDGGDVDEAALRADIEYTLSLPEVGGVYIGSIYQEFWTLTQEERIRLGRVVLDQVAGRVPVIVSASHTAVGAAVELAGDAVEHGADLVMLWPPYFGPRGDDAMVEYYRSVMEQVSVGFGFYNSGLSEMGYQMGPEALAALAAHPQMCVLKEASLRLDTFLRTLEAIGSDVLVSSPLEDYWLVSRMVDPEHAPAVLFGSSRALFLQTPGESMLADFYQATMASNWTRASALLHRILEASEALHGASLRGGHHPVGLIKAIRASFGQSGGMPRPPIPCPDAAAVETAVRGLAALGVHAATTEA